MSAGAGAGEARIIRQRDSHSDANDGQDGPFGIDVVGLKAVNEFSAEQENWEALERLGGIRGLARQLRVDPRAGLSQEEIDSDFTHRRAQYPGP